MARKFSIRNFILLCICNIIFITGCQKKQKSENDKASVSPKDTKESPVKLSEEIAQLKKQVESLMGLNKQARTEALSTLANVELTNRSDLYSKDDDKKKETLVVYIKPIDDMGDVVKAAGLVEVELWNLNAPPKDATLGQWKIEPDELKKYWTSSLMSTHYKLQFNVGDVLTGSEKELTLKVKFTDYLTGKVFKGQKVINK
ncbi:MAG: hypothetical protein A2Y10_12625 [Planctomycetes bacterium GWF2_41_51]|nr:MAG: hypothetical protein A2Y10_12625 [Planctomycetes bacterium GWF2_41_51]HBG27265.1 hypothetical protein [Phycisphaerales bacterium]